MSTDNPSVNDFIPADNSSSMIHHAPNVLMMGPPGSGKTHALRTLLDAGKEVFIVFTEPGMEVLSDTDPDQLHWKYIPPTSGGWDSMLQNFKNANKSPWDALIKQPDIKKKNYDAAVKLIETFADFTCDRTGKNYGNVGDWDTDRVIVLDSLSGLNQAAMQLIIGQSWGVSQPQWGAAMKAELQLINMLTFETKCMFILTAHQERLLDQVNGGMLIQVNALGQKNAPEIPKNFSDFIYTYYDKGEYFWATDFTNMDLKARNLPRQRELKPSFVPLLENWQARIDKGQK